MKKKWILFPCMFLCMVQLYAQSLLTAVKANSFSVADAVIVVDPNDDWLVQKAAGLLQSDINSVTGKTPAIIGSPNGKANIIIIGSVERSALVKQLLANKRVSIDKIKGKWEAYEMQVVNKPFPGVSSALVITGSDKRGTAFGVLELSKQIGVSPWYWWADVPVKKRTGIYIPNNLHVLDSPLVKYRGIFINDEAPAFAVWAKEKFGGVNHFVYEKMFELLLRLKANYLWPAMWGKAFNDDDTLNPVLADRYGIVMGTSHHEPMQRAQQEWKKYGKGQWNYQTNDSVLRDFWRKGIENMGTHESVVTIGMRGDGDMPMTQGSNIALLEKIVADQRRIITEVTGKPASQTPQAWALYKEVQDYYDKGMRVPDDVTLLLCDDNWGNIRKLPRITDAPRKGGYGIYYHFDYVGGPRSYKWLNTSPIARTWEQMHLAYEYNVRNIWVVNVGDLKPMEFPISFFLDYAWNPNRIRSTDLQNYTEQWAKAQFGSRYAADIAKLIAGYTKLNGRRKPELLDANTYSLLDYHEFENTVRTYNELLRKAEVINSSLPDEYKDAYFELVLHPVKACANLNELYFSVARNRYYAKYTSPLANSYADKVKELFIKDSLISLQYNTLANGKWNHIMDQTHIGYTNWSDPPKQKMPVVSYLDKNAIATDMDTAKMQVTAIDRMPARKTHNMFYERNGYISIQADHFSKAVNTSAVRWQVLPDHGRTGSAITAFPVTANEQVPEKNAPHVEYEIYTYDSGTIQLMAYFSPTLNFHNDEGLKYAISIDDEQPQIFSINKDDNKTRTWEGWVANNIIIKNTTHTIQKSGRHIIKFWMVSPAVVLQKLVADMGGVKQSYLGPPETGMIVNTIK